MRYVTWLSRLLGLSMRFSVERLESDVVAAEEILVLTETIEESALRKAAPALPRLRDGHTLDLVLDTDGTRGAAVALDLALLAEHAC